MTQAEFNFSAIIAERTRDFTGRAWVFAEIDRWLADADAPRLFVVTGEPGIGKTAIAARLTQLRELAAVHFCIAHQADTIDALNFARSISAQLARADEFARCLLAEKQVHVDVKIDVQENYGQIIGVQINALTVDAPSATVAFNRAVLDPLRRLYAGGTKRQMVILVDALDEAVQHVGAETIVDVLANAGQLPGRVRFVLTSRPEGAALRHFQERGIPHLVLDAGRAENQADVRAYVRERLAASPALQARVAGTSAGDFVEQVSAASGGNFLYLVWVLRAVAEGTQAADRLDALPVGLDGVYREFLRTRTVGKDIKLWRDRYRLVLGVLAAAREPLTAEQVGRFAGLGAQAVDDVLQDAQQFLSVQPGGAGACYQLYHQSLANFLSDRERAGEFWIDLPAMHRRIAAYYLRRSRGDWASCDLYGLRYLITHTIGAGLWDKTKQLLTNRTFVEAKCMAGMPSELVADYNAALLHLPTDSEIVPWAEFYRVAAGRIASDKGNVITLLISDADTDANSVASPADPLIGERRFLTARFQIRRLSDVTQAKTPFCCSWSPKQGIVATCSVDGEIVFRCVDGKVHSSFIAHEGAEVATCAWSPDGERLLTGGSDCSARVWDLSKGLEYPKEEKKKRWLSPDERWVTACAWSPSHPHIAVADRGGNVVIRDVDRNTMVATLRCPAAVNYCAYNPSGDCLALACDDGYVRVWCWSKEKKDPDPLPGHKASVQHCRWTLDGQYILSYNFEREVWKRKVWVWLAEDYDQCDTLASLNHYEGTTVCSWGVASHLEIATYGATCHRLKVFDVGPSGREVIGFNPEGNLILLTIRDS